VLMAFVGSDVCSLAMLPELYFSRDPPVREQITAPLRRNKNA